MDTYGPSKTDVHVLTNNEISYCTEFQADLLRYLYDLLTAFSKINKFVKYGSRVMVQELLPQIYMYSLTTHERTMCLVTCRLVSFNIFVKTNQSARSFLFP